jgi:hypothetical protein
LKFKPRIRNEREKIVGLGITIWVLEWSRRRWRWRRYQPPSPATELSERGERREWETEASEKEITNEWGNWKGGLYSPGSVRVSLSYINFNLSCYHLRVCSQVVREYAHEWEATGSNPPGEILNIFKKNFIKWRVIFIFYLIKNFLCGSPTWRFRLPRGDSVTVSCHGGLLRGESRKLYFARGESKRNFF